jgi:hypothetical protein
MQVEGALDFTGNHQLTALPTHLTVTRLNISGCTALTSLPPGLKCYELDAHDTALRTLPEDIQVEFKINLANCPNLTRLPINLKVGVLMLRDCTALPHLPEGLDVNYLDISGCTALRRWPTTGSLRFGELKMSGTRLRDMPSWITRLTHLDISNCPKLTHLPEGLQVTSWIALNDTTLTTLPESLWGVRVRWHNVLVTEQIVFRPETLTAASVINEHNAEVRRIMLEQIGYDRFFEMANTTVMDQDRDPGGERRLLNVDLPGEEPLVCLSVSCPSTERGYLIRVPPSIATCHQAAAWIAGFDDPNEYHPAIET